MKHNAAIGPLVAFLCALAAGPAHTQEVTVGWSEVMQTIDGFGACDAWYTQEIMTHPDRDEMLDVLFGRDGGAGLSILRHRVPAQRRQMVGYLPELAGGDLDFGAKPAHGIRFIDIDVPAGVTVTRALVQFAAKGNQTVSATLRIVGEASDSASTFREEPGDISNRPRTAASVTWNVPPWNSGERSDAQRTPDIAAIIQEIVNRRGWESGNALAIIITNRTGKRSAVTYDRSQADGAELTIEYEGGKLVRRVASSSDDAEEYGASDFAYACRLAEEAYRRGCTLNWAAAWSPPYEWKTTGVEQNGYLIRDHYQDYADYLESYRKRFRDTTGIALFGISPQNEPGRKPWESCEWHNTDFRDFIRDHLGPTLDSSCRIIVPEETNWNNVGDFYTPIRQDAGARGHVDILAGHVYGGDPDRSYDSLGKPVWETEWSYDTSNEDLGIGNGVEWAYNFWRLLVNAGVRACHHWWLVNMKSHEGDQQGLLNASPGVPGFTVPKRLWTIGNYSKFVRPGWKRMEATKTPARDVHIAAFRDTATGDFAIVAINKSTGDRPVTFRFDGFACDTVIPHRTSASEDLEPLSGIAAGGSFRATLRGRTVTTFVGRRS